MGFAVSFASFVVFVTLVVFVFKIELAVVSKGGCC